MHLCLERVHGGQWGETMIYKNGVGDGGGGVGGLLRNLPPLSGGRDQGEGCPSKKQTKIIIGWHCACFCWRKLGRGRGSVIVEFNCFHEWDLVIVVRASDCQCTSCNGLGFDPSIRRQSGLWGAADEALLNIVRKNNKIKSNKIPPV